VPSLRAETAPPFILRSGGVETDPRLIGTMSTCCCWRAAVGVLPNPKDPPKWGAVYSRSQSPAVCSVRDSRCLLEEKVLGSPSFYGLNELLRESEVLNHPTPPAVWLSAEGSPVRSPGASYKQGPGGGAGLALSPDFACATRFASFVLSGPEYGLPPLGPTMSEGSSLQFDAINSTFHFLFIFIIFHLLCFLRHISSVWGPFFWSTGVSTGCWRHATAGTPARAPPTPDGDGQDGGSYGRMEAPI